MHILAVRLNQILASRPRLAPVLQCCLSRAERMHIKPILKVY